MKLKLVEVNGQQYAAVQDGRPVYVYDGGKEVAYDAPATVAIISRLNAEAKTHREAKEAAEAKLKDFDGLDPAKARDAITKVQKIDDKQLLDAGKVEEVKAAAVKAIEDKYKPILEERDGLQRALHNEMIGGSFARSKFIAEKVAVPTDLIQSAFGNRFRIEEGKIVATDGDGKKVYSRSRPGEIADFEEALELLVEAYPNKDHILKGSGARGGGAKGGNGGGGAGDKTMSRAEFQKLDPAAQMKAVTTDGIAVID